MSKQTGSGAALQHVEHVSLSTQVLREIRSAIVLGDLAPGARLTFRDVAQRLNASVTPVREALLQLVAERVLSVGPGRTITVPLLTRAEFLELRAIRMSLEGMAAEAGSQAGRRGAGRRAGRDPSPARQGQDRARSAPGDDPESRLPFPPVRRGRTARPARHDREYLAADRSLSPPHLRRPEAASSTCRCASSASRATPIAP